MNVTLKQSFEFSTGLVYQNEFQVNTYSVTLKLLTVSTDSDAQNIAYERMKYWIYRVLQDSVLIDLFSDRLPAYQETGQRLLILPEEPVDQIIGIMLYLKLNSIMENRMVVTRVEISSTAGDNMVYSHYAGEELGPMKIDGWWSDPKPIWGTAKKPRGNNKVIELGRMPEWGDLDLDWNSPGEKENSTVVFADFNKNDDK